MSTLKRIAFIILLVSLLLSACNQPTPTNTPPKAEPGTFTEDKCPFGSIAGYKTRCGFLTVPEDYENPDGRLIRLAVAIIGSKSSMPKPDPVVYLEGGPGGSPIRGMIDYMDVLFTPILNTRDLILIDQRGTGYSEPALDCLAANQLSIDMLDENPSLEEAESQSLAAFLSCKEKWAAEGINLAEYNSANNARDLDMLRQALGYEKWNLYGISYGTRLALTTMRDYPQGLRSVVIDSVYPPQVSLDIDVPANAVRAFNELFDACTADADCNAAYPNLRQVFYALVDRLNANPVTFKIQLPELRDIQQSGQLVDALMTGDNLIGFLFQALYATSVIPNLPAVIYAADAGDFTSVSFLQSQFLESMNSISQGMYHSVQCYEENPFATVAQVSAALAEYPELGDSFGSPESGFELCAQWHDGKAPAVENQPVSSDIPTLVISGTLDPITPPAWGRLAASTLTNSYYVEIPGGGHGASLTEACPRSIVVAFFNDPDRQPDTACLPNRVAFNTPLTRIAIELTPADLGAYRTVVPADWKGNNIPGFYSPSGEMTDSLQFLLQNYPGTPESVMNLYISSLEAQGISFSKEPSATYQANDLAWSIYSGNLGFLAVDIAITESNGQSYLIILQSTTTQRQAYLQALVYPAMDAFEIK